MSDEEGFDEGFDEGHGGVISEAEGLVVSIGKAEIEEEPCYTQTIQDRGLSEIATVADRYYENFNDRIRDALPGKARLGNRKDREGKPIVDETGTGPSHVRWGSEKSSKSNKSREPSDDDESNDDRRTSGNRMRSSRARSFAEPAPRRERVRDWEADSPPPPRRRSTAPRPVSGDYGRLPYRNSFHHLPYAAASTNNLPYGRTPPPPYQPIYPVPYGAPRALPRYRSRSLTPPGRRRRRLSEANIKNKKEKIKETIKPIAAGGAGMVAGAFIGNAAGKGDMTATLVGAVIGAIGGSEAEEYWEKRKEKKEKKKERY